MLVSCFESKRIACRKSLLGVLLHYVGSTSLSVTKSHWRHIYIIYQRNLTWESVFSVIYHPSAESDLRERIFRNIHLFAKSDLRTYFQSHASTSGVSPWERIFIHIHPSAESDLRTYFQSHSSISSPWPENVFFPSHASTSGVRPWERILLHIHPSAEFDLRTYFHHTHFHPSAETDLRTYFHTHSSISGIWLKILFSVIFNEYYSSISGFWTENIFPVTFMTHCILI